jgi:uncharacterized membrane protein YqgA involved in biofilm formation
MGPFSVVSGTLLNAGAVIVGGLLGTVIGDRLPARIHESLFGVLGLFTILIGLLDALGSSSGKDAVNPLVLLGALLLGVLLGEVLDLEGRLNRFGDRLQRQLASEGSTVSEAFVTATLVFCVGPLSILGALDNGLSGDITKLAIKSTLDGFAALAFGATLGWGVLLSVVVILLYQGGISLAAHAVAPVLQANPQTIPALTAAGGVILMTIGLKLLKIRDLRVANWLPALVFAPLLVVLLALLPPIGR